MQTATEYFDEQIQERVIAQDLVARKMIIEISMEDYMDIKRQAKEMEKQQIIDTYIKGFCISGEGFNGEYGIKDFNNIKEEISVQQYYNETYGSKGSDEHFEHNLDEITTSSQTEISDEEMIQAAIKHSEIYTLKFIPRSSFIDGAKWYREQLKCKENG